MMKRRSQSKAEQISLSMYEKQRLNNLELNASRMEAAGLGTLAKNILVSKTQAATKPIVPKEEVSTDDMNSDDLLNEDRDYQPIEHEEGDEEEVVLVVPNPALEKAKKVLRQETTMVELALARSRKRTSSSKKQPTEKAIFVEQDKRDQPEQICAATNKDVRQQTQQPSQQQPSQQQPEFAMTRVRKKL